MLHNGFFLILGYEAERQVEKKSINKEYCKNSYKIVEKKKVLKKHHAIEENAASQSFLCKFRPSRLFRVRIKTMRYMANEILASFLR